MLPTVTQILPRFDFRVDAAVCEDLGTTRQNQEDAHLLAPELALFVVADGMGGHAAGEVASRLAVEQVSKEIARKGCQRAMEAYRNHPDLETRRKVIAELRRAVEKVNEVVHQRATAKPDCQGMGTTLDVLWLGRDRAFVAHVGDGRVYLARPSAVLQLTQDHCEGEVLKADGVMIPKRRSRSFERLVNAIGLSETVAVDALFVDVARGDRLLLCTDGVHGPIADEARLGRLLRAGKPRQTARSLVARAVERGNDNATALVIEVGESVVKRASGDRGLAAADVERARFSPLLLDLPLPAVLGALAAAVEVELEEGETLPRAIASDLVAYVLLEGLVSCADDRVVSTGAMLYAESLVGVWGGGDLPVVKQRARLLRVRADDFEEVCDSDPALGNQLHRRIAHHLARSSPRGQTVPPMESVLPPPPDSSPEGE